MMSRVIDRTSRRYGRLVVLERAGSSRGRASWLCQCDCGRTCVVIGNYLHSGRTRSCGCLARETRASTWRTHGLSGHPLYPTWRAMNQRCYYSKSSSYPNYGGRGIRICEEWRRDFKAWLTYVERLPHYSEQGRSLDRIDNAGIYEPGNVRWATLKEQAKNRRKRKRAAEWRAEMVSLWGLVVHLDTEGRKRHEALRRLCAALEGAND